MVLVRSRSISRTVPAKNSVCGERGVGTIAEQRASIQKIDQVCEYGIMRVRDVVPVWPLFQI